MLGAPAVTPSVGLGSPNYPPSRSDTVARRCPLLRTLLAANLYRSTRVRRLRVLVACLPSDTRERALVPLKSDWLGDTRRIAGSLLRDLQVGNELTPAAAPDARGDEPSPS